MRSFKIEKTKPIQSYNLPAKYRDECNRFVDKLKKNLGSSIKLLVLTGSGGNEKIVENISDLDFMIVVEDSIESKKVIDLLAKITQNTSIKIGTTFYKRNEFEKGLIDTKTISTLELLRKGIYNAIISDESLNIPALSDQYRRDMHKMVLGNYIHSLKRKLYNPIEEDVFQIEKEIRNIKKFIISSKEKLLIDPELIVKEFDAMYPNSPEIPKFETKQQLSKYFMSCFDFLDFISEKVIIRGSR
ncbi:hypothetical protein COU62_04535 [Candidatus Pacearchaeota archaeon CG10_big_fil_rev_8_21_14_0_10_35_219]|nr:MAG: hypothetical protein AUJ63_04990 [Candidatus Pacearchaeota archaeon CG1_02_35_32]PIO07258.1 MAG: hypothetical protein COU62_04535 [Candidatus Pacearchaeota archaeon CG10_big_fil_rev_8_21_14_0_10_35_219]PIY81174.1 MAG: hypothetical protein COY79_03980 [Candidatus Pacearchaeota archaeon CG_4_10_14_0_8_um_filter_35_169]PIZ79425.1 MAG: hypothetical protein COY00_03985 [Candidatus Pacearchaeota archaeon CG_4_10_14_0_2_um_filter_35_33]PJB93989.1 MAG: hypothetical protein CO081_03510 [Candidat